MDMVVQETRVIQQWIQLPVGANGIQIKDAMDMLVEANNSNDSIDCVIDDRSIRVRVVDGAIQLYNEVENTSGAAWHPSRSAVKP